jgi:hypothetical protein
MSDSLLQIGLDIGNGSIKLMSKEQRLSIPSVISTEINASGGRVKLEGVEYLLGEAALKNDRSTRQFTSDSPAIKVKDIKRLYFGTLAHYPNLSTTKSIQLVLSSNAFRKYGEEITKVLSGTQIVELNGKHHNISTEVLRVVPEGYGVIASKQPVETKRGKETVELDITGHRIFLIDLGNGTAIKSVYESGCREPLVFTPERYGVSKLFNAFQESTADVNYGTKLDIGEVRLIIEKGQLNYKGLDFVSIYKQCLTSWWEKGLKPIVDEAVAYQSKGYTVVCTGGGILLPAMKPSLAKKGFHWVKDPVFANAQGLLMLATTKKELVEVAA